ncbi:hypothetical protein V6N13_000581 [Hibiscus sabdariffa]
MDFPGRCQETSSRQCWTCYVANVPPCFHWQGPWQAFDLHGVVKCDRTSKRTKDRMLVHDLAKDLHYEGFEGLSIMRFSGGDGCNNFHGSRASCGGVLHNEKVLRLKRNSGVVLEGLNHAWYLDYRKLEVELDCLSVVRILHEKWVLRLIVIL